MSRRLLKAAEAIRGVVSMAILTELRDPRVKNVTVVGVEVPEARQARLGRRPLRFADLNAIGGALASPRPEGPDHRGFLPFSQMPAKIRMTPIA